ncbi:hypothetical protein BFJ63_vAg17537 [Fusarium oxysporum f. sp. narcissi]|uniref:Uncharacterized protein n=1 Tax=Fusarium oxysporum f. sp. narcissi TaxID=451672 RepID=A0A4Q2UYD9_FUSOX|nr:hypothetical protein BFJ63_vAg17537 [Fusarium oxysporum f. sp. narcissi]
MPGTPKKRGRPRKYGTPKDKAKHDVVAKRARRRLRKQTTHDSIRFQIYVSSQTEASPVTPSQGIESYETSLLGDPPEADSSLNRSESPTLSIDAVVARGEQSPRWRSRMKTNPSAIRWNQMPTQPSVSWKETGDALVAARGR